MSQNPDSIGAAAPFDLLAPSARAELRAGFHGTDRTAGVIAAAEYLERAESRSSDLAVLGIFLAPLALYVVVTVLEAALVVGGAL